MIGSTKHLASIHHGPRPTFNDTRSCEVHLIDTELPSPPESIDVEVVELLRPITTFPSPEALTKQMMEDIARTRDILGA